LGEAESCDSDCGSDKLGSIRRVRKRCYKCKKEWHLCKRSFLESRQISYSKFIWFLLLYSKDYGIIQVCEELLIERKTGLQLLTDLRNLILGDNIISNAAEGFILVINEVNNIEMKPLKDSADNKNYVIIEPERYKEVGGLYSFLIKAKWVGRNIGCKNNLNAFLSYIKMKTVSYRGISEGQFIQYFSEQILKYNYREKDHFEMLLSFLLHPQNE
jgi:transposase